MNSIYLSLLWKLAIYSYPLFPGSWDELPSAEYDYLICLRAFGEGPYPRLSDSPSTLSTQSLLFMFDLKWF